MKAFYDWYISNAKYNSALRQSMYLTIGITSVNLICAGVSVACRFF